MDIVEEYDPELLPKLRELIADPLDVKLNLDLPRSSFTIFYDENRERLKSQNSFLRLEHFQKFVQAIW